MITALMRQNRLTATNERKSIKGDGLMVQTGKTEIDIHGMTVSDAKHKLERLIAQAPPNVELVVIHGYSGGNALCNMVRKTLKSKRIKQRILSMNPGETTLIID